MQEFTVKEISDILSHIMKNAFPEVVAVTGEISQISKQNSSGHIYFVLKEGEAQLNATYFKYYHVANKVTPKLGDKVKVIGDIKTYDRSSSYQINVKKIEYDSEGILLKQYEEMKRKLQNEGLFEQERKRQIAKYPYKIAVLTSLTGAVIRDFIITTQNEKGKYLIDVWNIPVQNIEKAQIVADTIVKAGSHVELYDVIVVMRGGGSIEDLSIFNTEIIARAVVSSKVPVISAIGHETDTTIIDFVSDYRAATPTAAAVYLSSNYKKSYQLLDKNRIFLRKTIDNILQKNVQYIDILSLKLDKQSISNKLIQLNQTIANFNHRMQLALQKKINSNNALLSRYENKLSPKNPNYLLDRYEMQLASNYKDINRIIKKKINDSITKEFLFIKNIKNIVLNNIYKKNDSLMNYHKRLLVSNPANKLKQYSSKLDNIEKSLIKAIKTKHLVLNNSLQNSNIFLKKSIANYLFKESAKVSTNEYKLSLLNPYNVLERGYAIVYQQGEILSSVDKATLNSELEIKLKDGSITALPEKINQNNKNIDAVNSIEKVLK